VTIERHLVDGGGYQGKRKASKKFVRAVKERSSRMLARVGKEWSGGGGCDSNRKRAPWRGNVQRKAQPEKDCVTWG